MEWSLRTESRGWGGKNDIFLFFVIFVGGVCVSDVLGSTGIGPLSGLVNKNLL